MKCELCGREVEEYTTHHLIPRSEDGQPDNIAIVCRPCHSMIHRLFSNRELAENYSSIKGLKDHPEIEKFIRWVRKQDPNKKVKIR
ncbi:MAG: HNH endonuclease [Calditrichaeota bacterium]|nr:HNH endonuclease [Calditrichota bacterium]RQV92485.1 MAG: HNH endonuclease [bacterium]RQV99182.1 MAG: HNH endonuclease [Calditrichota bacterium]